MKNIRACEEGLGEVSEAKIYKILPPIPYVSFVNRDFPICSHLHNLLYTNASHIQKIMYLCSVR
nr:MAG TPA: hypothetical protein [Caudoviricetes sp.]